MDKKKKAFIGVYGCQMNISDAERMEGQLATLGYERTENMDAADLILLNTCCVRESAEDKVYGKIGEIKHLKKQNPRLIFGITGCMAQKEGDALINTDTGEKYVIGETDTLEGVYCINKGYAVFRRIEILDENEEYAIVSKNTTYGLSRYDHIVRNADKVKEEDILY